jgi:hypothetical protein
MSLELIQAELDELGRAKDGIRDRMRDLVAKRDALLAEKSAAGVLDALPPSQRDAVVKLAALEAAGESLKVEG